MITVIPLFSLLGCYGPTPAPGLLCSQVGGCPNGQTCDIGSGTCASVANLSCTAPAMACEDSCVDADNDVYNCGACGNGCGPRSTCDQGQCVDAEAPIDCNDELHNGNETDTDCGGGCAPCPAGASCAGPSDCETGLCESGVCKTCDSSEACEDNRYCTEDQRCAPIVPTGEACTDDAGCSSGFCTDGVCCESRCDGTCETCDATGSCVAVPAGGDSGGDCPANGDCGNRGTCDGARGCELVTEGTSCDLNSCAGGASGVGQCTGTGTCEAVSGASCDPYVCGPSDTCLQSCSGHGDCADGNFCDGGDCAPKLQDGITCTTNDECSSGACADGVCCNNSCAGTCESCNQTGNVGTCTPFPEDSDPEADCSTQAVGTCGRTGACSGASSCKLWDAGTQCGGATCSGYTLYQNGTCNGSGTCNRASSSCAPYACGGGACRTSCPTPLSRNGCHPNYWCSYANECVASSASGALCVFDAQCLSNVCDRSNPNTLNVGNCL